MRPKQGGTGRAQSAPCSFPLRHSACAVLERCRLGEAISPINLATVASGALDGYKAEVAINLWWTMLPQPRAVPAPARRASARPLRLLVATLGLAASASWAPAALAGERLAGRTHVIDGDTVVVGGITVRLKGIAAPEVTYFGDPSEPGGEEAKAFLVELVEDQTVVCDLTNERTHGRRVGWCYRQGQDIAEAVIAAGFARDCPRYSGGRYADVEPPQAADLPFPGYCRLR